MGTGPAVGSVLCASGSDCTIHASDPVNFIRSLISFLFLIRIFNLAAFLTRRRPNGETATVTERKHGPVVSALV